MSCSDERSRTAAWPATCSLAWYAPCLVSCWPWSWPYRWALLTGTEPWWDRRLSPFIYLLYPIPHVVLLPLVIILFGIGDLSKIVLIGLIVFFQILVTTRDAARAIHPNYLLTMRSLGASRAQIYGHVIWPATLPRILTALRISIGTAVASVLSSWTPGAWPTTSGSTRASLAWPPWD